MLKILISTGLAAVLVGVVIPEFRSSPTGISRPAEETAAPGAVKSMATNPARPARSPVVPARSEFVDSSKVNAIARSAQTGSARSAEATASRRAGIDPPQLRQLRALWVDAFGPGFKTPQEVDRLIQDAKAMRLNALFVQVSRRADCYCNRSAMPRTADPAVPAGFDPLEDVISKAHAAGIQVHAWIITTSVWNATAPVGASDHPYLVHGLGARGREFWLNARQDGETRMGPDSFLDPGHPDAAEFIARMYANVVENYAVDGVQFDRVRYPDSGDPNFNPVWGYNPTSLERFLKETNRRSIPAPTDPAWVQWRRDQITNLVRRVYLEVKAIRPEVWVSAATITYKEAPASLEQFERTRTYNEVLQDWPAWMQEGILDLNIPMNYKRDREPDQSKWFDGWNRFAVQTRAAGLVAVGGAMYINPLDDSYRQLKRSLETAGVSGWVGYSYRTPDTEVFAGKRASSDALRQFSDRLATNGAPFTQSAGWGVPPAVSGVLGRVVRAGQGVPGLWVEVSGANNEVRRIQTDANGFFGARLAPGGYSAQTLEPAVAVRLELRAGQVLRADDLELP